MANYLEYTYLRSVFDMCSNAGACVVVAHTHNAQCVACIGWQLAQVHIGRRVVACAKFYCYGQLLLYDIVYRRLNGVYIVVGEWTGQGIVALAFFAFYMCIATSSATEHPYHRLVQNMLGGVHGRVLLLVMLV